MSKSAITHTCEYPQLKAAQRKLAELNEQLAEVETSLTSIPSDAAMLQAEAARMLGVQVKCLGRQEAADLRHRREVLIEAVAQQTRAVEAANREAERIVRQQHEPRHRDLCFKIVEAAETLKRLTREEEDFRRGLGNQCGVDGDSLRRMPIVLGNFQGTREVCQAVCARINESMGDYAEELDATAS